MKYTTALFVFFNALFALARADSVGTGCSATATLTARPSASWSTGDGNMSQIFDITVQNSGSCPLNNVGLSFDFPENSRITQEWNLVPEVLYTLISNFGSSIQVGASVTAGMVVSIPQASFSSLTGSAVHVYGAACPDSCSNSGATSAPSSAPSPSSAPTSAPSSCAMVPETLQTSPSSYTDSQGNTYTNVNATLTNNGASSLSSITIAERPEAVVNNIKGLVAQPNNPGFYTLPSSALPLAPGASYTFSYTYYDTRGKGFDVLSCSFSSAPSQPTSAPSSAPSSPSNAPTSSAPSGPAPNCQGSAVAVRRNQAPWSDAQGYTYQIYDIIANNTGTCPFTTIAVYFVGNITQAWNYDIPSGLLSGYGSYGIAAGQVYTGAGFVFAMPPTPVAGAPTIPVLGRMVTRCSAPCASSS